MNRGARSACSVLALALLLAPGWVAPASPAPGSSPSTRPLAVTLEWPSELAALPYDAADPHAAARRLVLQVADELGGDPGVADALLQPLDDRVSASGHHVRFAARWHDAPVGGVSAAIHYSSGGAPWLATLNLPDHLPPQRVSPPPTAADLERSFHASWLRQPSGADARDSPPMIHPTGPAVFEWDLVDGVYYESFRATMRAPHAAEPASAGWDLRVHPTAPDLDALAPRWLGAEGTGRVFPVSPEVGARHPNLVDDPEGRETPLLANLTRTLPLHRLNGPIGGTYTLHGQWVDVQTSTNDTGASFTYTRDDPRFEDTMAYHHLDAAQALLQTLGFADANAEDQIVTAPEWGMYNAFYYFDDYITFGYHAETPGGLADAAEDADVVVHEYGHAVQLDILPWDQWEGEELSAIAEGFADIFAVLVLLDAQEGYDPPCLADWFGSYFDVERADGVAGCFRRTDSDLVWDQALDAEGHYAGQVLSGFAWNLTLALGRDVALRLILEANYLHPLSGGDMRTWAESVLRASDALYAGQHNAMVAWSAYDRHLDTPFLDAMIGVPYVNRDVPRITGLSPRDFVAAGRALSVSGRFFVDDAAAQAPTLLLGGQAVPLLDYSPSGRWLRAQVPDLEPGPYEVRVQRSDGQILTWPDAIRVLGPLRIEPFPPVQAAAGDQFSIFGAGLGAGPDPNATIQAFTVPWVGGQLASLPARAYADGRRLDITVPADLAGRYLGLEIQRSDGASWFDWGALTVNFPELELRVTQEPGAATDVLLPPAAGGGPEWVLEIANIGKGTAELSPERPLDYDVRIFPEGHGISGAWYGNGNLTASLAPGAVVRLPLDLHPLCGCNATQWGTPPVGTWAGEAGSFPPPDEDQRNDNNHVQFRHRFLLPEEPQPPALPLPGP